METSNFNMNDRNANGVEENKFKINKSQKIALIVVLVVALWILSSLIISPSITSDETEDTKGKKSSNVSVYISPLERTNHTRIASINGVTEAAKKIEIKAQVEGIVSKIIASEGSVIKKGDKILTIEPRDRGARVKEAEALVKKSHIIYLSAQKLAKRKLQSEDKAESAKADYERAKADLIKAEINLKNSSLIAPFDGYLQAINAEVGTLVGPNVRVGSGSFNDGSDVAVMLDLNELKISGHVAEKTVGLIKQGMKATILTADKRDLSGEVKYVSAESQTETRGFLIEVIAPNIDPNPVPAGMTAEISLPIETRLAVYLPYNSLTMEKNKDTGEEVIGVKLFIPEVNKQNSDTALKGTVAFKKITSYDRDIGGIWVADIPEDAYLITRGFGYAENGEKVIGVLPKKPDPKSTENEPK